MKIKINQISSRFIILGSTIIPSLMGCGVKTTPVSSVLSQRPDIPFQGPAQIDEIRVNTNTKSGTDTDTKTEIKDEVTSE